MFTIVRIAGKQYKVAPKDVITVNLLPGDVGETLTFTDVLLAHDDKGISVGKPTVKGATVTAKILEHVKGEKIQIRRFKSKVRHRKRRGFRAQLTKLEVMSVS